MTIFERAAPRGPNVLVITEVLLLGGTAALLLIKWLRGLLSYYIHPRFDMLIVVAGVVLLLMAATRLRSVFDPAVTRPGWAYLLLAVPLLFGTLVPARPLGADTLAGRGVELNSVAPAGRELRLGDDTTRWNLLDWSSALTMRGPELDGSPIDVVGFVFQEPALGADAFYVVRYVVTCCAADGAGVGLPVQWPAGQALPADSWVRVRGTIVTASLAGAEQPAIKAESVEPVPQPESPYLYP